jgi:glycine/D-amino acid oxidase-like deaminating enzyme
MGSLWLAERHAYPQTTLPARADVVVVGGGLVGVSIALRLAEDGRAPVVVDREGVAAGASGRNGGLLLPGTAEPYPALVARWSRPTARALWEQAEWGARRLVERIEDLGSACAWRPEGALHVAASVAEAAMLREAMALLAADGFPARWMEPGELAAWAPAARPGQLQGALVHPGGGPLHSGRLVTGLAAEAARRGACFVDEANVTALRGTSAGVVVETEAGAISADAVVVANNAWAGRLLPELADLITPVRGQVLASAPIAPGAIRGAWSLNEGYEYFQQLPDGRLVLGGMRWTAAGMEVGIDRPNVNPSIQRRLEEWFELVFPTVGPLEVERRWAGIMAWTPDRLPFIGPLGASGRLWLAAAFNGHGLPFAQLAAEIVGAGLAGRPPPEHSDLLAPARLLRAAGHGQPVRPRV